jgi:uncharacterized membrane protein YhaH (DUF805 family)
MLDNLLELLSTIEGRASRRHWWAAMAVYVAMAVSIMLLNILFSSGLLAITGYIVYIMTVIGCFIVSIRRLHDIGYSGLTVLLYLIPVAGPLIMLILLGTLPGTIGKNVYGKAFTLRRRPAEHTISNMYSTAPHAPLMASTHADARSEST